MFWKTKVIKNNDAPEPDTTTLSEKALSAKKYVLSIWPTATCSGGPVKAFWPGQGERLVYMVIRASYWSGIDGEGKSASEAWIDAATRLHLSQLRADLAKSKLRVETLEAELLKHDVCPTCFLKFSGPHCHSTGAKIDENKEKRSSQI
jgi:hypothetical protein